MTAFIRRFLATPTIEQLTRIEQIAIVDATPRSPVTGVGTGMLMLVGEFEDGPFNEPTEVFGENDEATKFGGFGYKYGSLVSQNPCARVHLGENWNGNAFIQAKFLRPPRKVCVRVDTRVGNVQLRPLASLRTALGPFALAVGQQLTVAPDGGAGVTTTAIAATAATRDGIAFPGAGNNSEFVGGEQIGITIDDNPEVIVTFQAADQTAAQVAARINGFIGYAGASTILAGTGVRIAGVVLGTSGEVTLRNVSGTPLTNIGHTAGSTAGTGNVANLAAVTAAEVAALVNALAGVDAIVDADGRVVVYSPTVATGSINVTAGAMATALGLLAGTTVVANVGEAAVIPAGTRVRTAGGAEWVVMQTISVPAGTVANPNPAFYSAPIRPALDNGTALAAVAGTITTLVDIPRGRMFSVTNADNVSAALSESAIDLAYEAAFAATVDTTKVTREASVSLSARRSTVVNRAGRTNAITASAEGNFGRKFHARIAFGRTQSQAIADVADATQFASDRVFCTYLGMAIRVPEIAVLGSAGGTGFTDDGVVLVGANGALAYINAALPPEENPGQDTGLLSFVLGLEGVIPTGATSPQQLTLESYEAFKAAGLCVPRVDQRAVVAFQSEVTTSQEDGRKTQKRRKMADFIQDTIAILLLPYSKKLATEAREAGIDSKLNALLRGLESKNDPDRARIRTQKMTNTTAQNPTFADRGISSRKVQVGLLNSLDTFLVETEIGEGVVITRDS